MQLGRRLDTWCWSCSFNNAPKTLSLEGQWCAGKHRSKQSYFVAKIANITKKTFDKQLARIGPCPISAVGYENHGRFLWSMKLHPKDGFIWNKECVEDDMMRTRASMYARTSAWGILKLKSRRLGGKMSVLMTTEPNVWEKITAYVAENNEKAA